MKNETQKSLPKMEASKMDKAGARWSAMTPLPGAVCKQSVCCGRPGCRCASGLPEDRHGPYFYRFWRENGRLRKAYVKANEVPAVRWACRLHREVYERDLRHRRDDAAGFERFRRIRRQVREAEQSNKENRHGSPRA